MVQKSTRTNGAKVLLGFLWKLLFRKAKRDVLFHGRSITTISSRKDNRKRNSTRSSSGDDNDTRLELKYPKVKQRSSDVGAREFYRRFVRSSLHYQFYSWYFNLLPLILFNRTALFNRTGKKNICFWNA